jgi:hypothetical protein
VEQKGNIKRSERQRNHRAEQKKKQKNRITGNTNESRFGEREKKGNCQPNRKHKGIGIQRKLDKKIIFTFVF